jgi:hypothetical protein
MTKTAWIATDLYGVQAGALDEERGENKIAKCQD